MKAIKMMFTAAAVATVVFGGFAAAEPPTYVEVAVIDGGENGRNGSSDQLGLEVAGDYGIDENWYVGGVLGRFDRDSSGGDIENTYLNVHGGYAFAVSEKTTVLFEGGLWFGEQENPGDSDTDPRALELKAGASHAVSEKFSLSGTLATVRGDLDMPGDDDLRNFVWSLGGAYAFNELFSLNLKLVDGVNGVNGQDEVLRLGARWTF